MGLPSSADVLVARGGGVFGDSQWITECFTDRISFGDCLEITTTDLQDNTRWITKSSWRDICQ
jgi:hypothetical protein